MVIAKIRAWLYGVAALVAAFVAIYIAGRRDGAGRLRVDQLEADLDAVKTAKEIADENAGADRGDIDRRLDKWMRD